MLWKLFKKYWDIFGGVMAGAILSVLAKFHLETIQLYTSIMILCLTSIGVFTIIRQTIEKSKRKKTIIDNMVNSQRSVKAIRVARNPTKDGEELGKILVNLWRELKGTMEKLFKALDKVKGFILTAALAVLTIIEFCGGYINEALGGILVYNDIELVPIITLVATTIVGVLSNGYTKEQREKIKALFTKSNANKLVLEEIKKTLKDNEAKLKEFKKILTVKQNELSNLNVELESAKNKHEAKKEMYLMVPKLATTEDVELAAHEVQDVEARINEKNIEIANVEISINNLTTTINALKSQL